MDAFDPSVLVSESYTHVIDFRSITEEELAEIRMPFNLQVGQCRKGCLMGQSRLTCTYT